MRAAVTAVLLVLSMASAQATPKDDLLAADRAFSRLSTTRGHNYAVLAFIANDGHLVSDGIFAPITGTAQAFRRLALERGRGVLSWEPEIADVSADGSLGWTEGRWLDRVGKTQTGGHYLTVWVRRGGRWRVREEMNVADELGKETGK